jgi:hypothetical protein
MFVPAQRNPPVPLGDSLRTVHNAPLPVVSTRPLHSSAAAHTFNEIGVPQPTKAIMPGSLNKFIDRRTSATLLQRSASQVCTFSPKFLSYLACQGRPLCPVRCTASLLSQ